MAALPQPGELFEGKYLIAEEIGSGGFASVFKATDEATDRVVAIKILVPLEHESDYGERLHQRFQREARLLAGLRSQHTVTLYEFGASESGLLYLVFEFVAGTTLRDLLRLKGAQSAERVVNILRQACTALHEAHQCGILHRDVKPANIMVYDHLEMRDVVKLIDFGIAKPMAGTGDDLDDATITTFGSVLGTPRYMSPEQLAHQELTPASDIYSLGLVAFELLTGGRAIDEETVTGILRSQLSAEAITLPRDRGIPRGLRVVVEKMIERRRDDRYQDLAQVVRDLDDWDDVDMPPTVMRLAVGGVVVGAALLVVAALLGRGETPVAAVPVQRPAVALGTPAWVLPVDAPGLAFAWIGSTQEYRLVGGSDARFIHPIARRVVSVERDGVAVPPGRRFVADLSEWDGVTMSYEMTVREFGEEDFVMMARAEMAAISIARPFIERVYTTAIEQAVARGHDIEQSKVWTPPLLDAKPKSKGGTDDGLDIAMPGGNQFTFAHQATLRAAAHNDWYSVIRECIQFADSHTGCARQVARAHHKRDEPDEACYWYRQIESIPAGMDCSKEVPRPSYERFSRPF